MRRCSAILLLGLLFSAQPADAQRLYSLTVSIHEGMNPTLTKENVEQILGGASDILKRNGCDVKFELKGPIQTFTSAPAHIKDPSTLEAAHLVSADVKVVQRINYCVGKYLKEPVIGCSWRPEGRRRTVIVTTESVGALPGIHPVLWAHEFGHTTGLLHRKDANDVALMTPC